MAQPPGSFPPPPEPVAPDADDESGPFSRSPAERGGYGAGYGAPAGFYPFDLGRIVTLTRSLLRFAWRPMLGAVLVPVAVVYAAIIPVELATPPQVEDFLFEYQTRVALGRLPDPLPPELRPWLIVPVLTGILSWLGAAVASAAVIHMAHSLLRGQSSAIRPSLGMAVRRLPALVGAQLLVLLAVLGVVLVSVVLGALPAVGGGLPAFVGLIVIVGGIAAALFISVRWSLVAQAIVVEQLGPIDGLSRSWRLVAGSGWRVLGYVVLVWLLGFLLGLLIGVTIGLFSVALLPVSRAFDVVVPNLAGVAAVVVSLPITTLIMTLLYFDLGYRAGESPPQPGDARRAV